MHRRLTPGAPLRRLPPLAPLRPTNTCTATAACCCHTHLQDKQGCTPLFIAVQVDAARVAFYLVSKGAGLEVRERREHLDLGSRPG